MASISLIRRKLTEAVCSFSLATKLAVAVLTVFPFRTVSGAGLTWPEGRLLPQFSAPAGTLDCIDVSSASGVEADLFSSLEGIVNRTQPRIACVSDHSAEGKFTWLKLHDLKWQMTDGYADIVKYRSELTGLVVTDPNLPDTLNLAATLAGLKNELVCDARLLPKLTNAPCNLPIRDDLRGRFRDRYEVYGYLRTNVWPDCTHRIIAGMGPNLHGNLRDYLVSAKAASVWLDPRNSRDAAMLASFVSDMTPAHGVYLGWWPDEDAGLKWIGQYGIAVLASDFYDNGSVFAGTTQSIHVPAIPPAPPLENKIYVSIFISDGDNVQYMQHHLKQAWDDPARGSVPIGWTVSPLAADLDPGMLNYYWSTGTTNDCLVSGPSGAGYARLDFWNEPDLNAFTRMSDSYLQRSGIRVITVWLKVTDAIGNSFNANCPSLLGLISHEGGTFSTLHGQLPTIGLAGGANYSSSVSKIEDGIANAAKGWDGKHPMFIAVQGNGWRISAEDCRAIARSLDKSRFSVVRPDDLFLLYRESSGKSAEATDPNGWVNVMPPASLDGWTRVAIPPSKPLGRAQWHLDAGRRLLICDGDGGHDMLRFDRKLTNCVFHVECRYIPVTRSKPNYNSGIFIRNSSDGTVWHQCQLTQDGGYLFGETPAGGGLKRFKSPASETRMKPAGEWNTVEVKAEGRTLSVWLNGAQVCDYSDCGEPAGYIALESEGSAIQFRNLKLKELP